MPTTTPFNNLITFSRGSNATVTGSNGLIQWAPNNLLTFSEQFDNAAWTKGAGATVVANNQVAPDGTTTADTITFTAGGATEFVRAFASFTVGLVYTVSVYARRISGTPTFIFDVGNGAAISGAQPITSEWQRFSFTFTFSGANQWVDLEASAAGSIAFWGAQLELGSTATTYNSTTVKNLLGFSEAFDNAGWIKSAASIVTGAQANPVNGLFNAQKLMEDTANAQHFVYNGSSVASGPVTFSVYAKFAGRQWIRLVGAGSVNVWFDLVNGVLGTVTSGATASITSVGSGWYRCSVTVTYVNTLNYIFLANANNATSYTGDGNSGVYIYGAHLSDSASLDPYVPTPGAAPSSTAFYGPRFDFDPVTLQPRGLLVEEQRTNLLLRSDDFTTTWAASGATITANATASPDGTVNADALVEDGTTGLHLTQQFFTFLNATAYTVSVFIKPSTRTWVQVLLPAAAFTASQGGFFNLSGAGSLGTVTGAPTSRSITAVGNGWYRITITATSTAAAGGNIAVVAASADGTTSYAGTNGATALFPWGAQLEAGAFATSYIPTVASTVTRSADVATITGQNFAQWYRQDEGCLVVEASNPANGVLYILDANNSTVNEEIRLATTSTSGSLVVWQAGAVQANITVGSMTANAPFKMAAGYAANNTNAALNGTVGTADTSFVSPTVSRLQIGASFTQYLNGHIRNIRYIPARVADFQLQALST